MSDYFPAACYSCGQPGHYAADCPERSAKAHGEHHSARVVPPPLPPRRPANQVADARAWAAKIREEMGWARGSAYAEPDTEGESF